MIVTEWVKRESQITKVNADANQGTDLFVTRQKMLLTSIAVYQERERKETEFDQLSSKYLYEYGWNEGRAYSEIRIDEYSYSRQYRPRNKLNQVYVPEVWLWIGRGSDWYQYHVVKKADGQNSPHRLKIDKDFVMNANDKVYAFIKWPRLEFTRTSEPEQLLTARQKEQFNSHVGSLTFHIQGVNA